MLTTRHAAGVVPTVLQFEAAAVVPPSPTWPEVTVGAAAVSVRVLLAGLINVGDVCKTTFPLPVELAAGVDPEYGIRVEVRMSRMVVFVPAAALVIIPVVPPIVCQSGVTTTT
jgi:hypothetical protein